MPRRKNKKKINVYQFWTNGGDPPEPYATCIQRMSEAPWIDSHELIRFDPWPGIMICNSVELLKLQRAQEDPCGLFLDADMYFLTEPLFDKDDYPYFDHMPTKPPKGVSMRTTAKGNLHNRKPSIKYGRPHIACFYVNGCVDWFLRLKLPTRPGHALGWCNMMLAAQPSHIITRDNFHHEYDRRGHHGAPKR